MIKEKIIKEIKSFTLTILGAFCIFILINSKVSAVVRVQQSSMENTLFNNQRLVVDKLSYNFGKPKRGDIIIFSENKEKETIIDNTFEIINSITSRSDYLNEDNRLVKRVIGIEGDEIDIKDGYVFLNGQKLDEPYIKGETVSEDLKFPIKVSKNKLFVLGDNRVVSKDSRKFGLIDYKQIEGKAVFRVFPFNKIGIIK